MNSSALTLALALTLFVITGSGPGIAADWPTYQHDIRRSGVALEPLPDGPLKPTWVYESPQPPKPAWDGAAKWDAYAGLRGLKSMRNYDPVYHVTVAGQSLFFGSSADDTVRCLDTRTGRERWSFTTDGPVRIAPTAAGGRLYFGSDDGRAYSLDATDGRLLWSASPAPEHPQVLHDGHFISLWPCRTGVLVDGDTAYFAAGMLPWKETYLCAVDALTGKPAGPGRYIRRLEKVTLEGPMLASPQRLLSPQGRVAPLLFDKRDGTPLGMLEGGGGSFVLLTEDARVLHGPGNKTGWVQESQETDRSKVATFNGANALIVHSNTAYLLTDRGVLALDRTTRKEVWQRLGNPPHALILAGQTVYAGGTDTVTAIDARDGQPRWEGRVRGRAHGLAAADGALFVSTDEGVIHCFRPRPGEPATSTPPEPPTEAPEVPVTNRLHLASGPWLRFVGPDHALVEWETPEPSPTVLHWTAAGEAPGTSSDEALKTQHTAHLRGLRRDRTYSYTLEGLAQGQPARTDPFECDTFFNYSVPPVPDRPSPYPPDELSARYANAAAAILDRSAIDQGVCLVLEAGEGRLAYELARRSRLRVVGVEADPRKVDAARRALLPTGIYGTRVVIHHVPSLASLPFTGHFANLVVSDALLVRPELTLPAAEVARCLRPCGGIALLGQPTSNPARTGDRELESWLKASGPLPGIQTQVADGWIRLERGSLPGAGAWSHQYGTAANAAYGGESLLGARRSADFEVQWLGRPGPRAQADRNGRKPSPLAVNGRLFMQGLQRSIALDAFNGTILWSREIPGFERFNLPRDCSNWCADDAHVYLVLRNRCWRLDAASGERVGSYPVKPGARPGWRYDWGFIAVRGNHVLGSALKEGSAFTNYWGGADAGWYDATAGPATHKVCSENLFALDRSTGQPQWSYTGGLILNSTITIAGERLAFLESRHPAVLASDTHRVGLPELWQQVRLVSLDLKSGRPVYDRSILPAAGDVMASLAYSTHTLVLVTSGAKAYHVYAFDAGDGRPLWQSDFPWPKDNHGGHMARPAIVEDRLFVRPGVFELRTGRALAPAMPGGGCGTYAASKDALIFRDGNVTLWDPANGTASGWERLRPDCWLSTVPADGLLLSPEAGGGCSCGNWLETSIAFKPRAHGL